jgi:recombination protein RecT
MAEGGISRPVEMGREEVLPAPRHERLEQPLGLPVEEVGASMWLKCAVHELEKWVPSSTEYRREIARSATPQPQPAAVHR